MRLNEINNFPLGRGMRRIREKDMVKRKNPKRAYINRNCVYATSVAKLTAADPVYRQAQQGGGNGR
jgi:hypothetical protein